jgi:CBS-domain-containing membrane protein
MGGGEDFIKNFTNGPFAKMFKNMAGGASMNQMAQMGKQSAMKERLRKKMEEKKMREFATAQATASQSQASVQALASQATAPKTYVVKIGDEKQEKSNAMSEEELVKMFKSKKKDKKKK